MTAFVFPVAVAVAAVVCAPLGMVAYVALFRLLRRPSDALGRRQRLSVLLSDLSLAEGALGFFLAPAWIVAFGLLSLIEVARLQLVGLAGGTPAPSAHVVALVSTPTSLVASIDGHIVLADYAPDDVPGMLRGMAHRIEAFGYGPNPDIDPVVDPRLV